MFILKIVLLTLIIYSTISTLVFILSKENEEIIIFFGLGIVGTILYFICRTFGKIRKYFKYHYKKRSIFQDKTGNKYICSVNEASDIMCLQSYIIIKRYAHQSEWEGLPEIPKDVILQSKRTCKYCKYDDMCGEEYDYILCNHSENGIEYDKFEKK